MKCVSFCVLAALAAASGTGMAGANPKPTGHRAMFASVAAANASRLTVQERAERRFLQAAAAASRFEGQAAWMALGASNDPGVRSFAATLINHHAAAGNVLLHMLHARGMALPMLANDQRKTLNRLAKLQGAKFDLEFMAEVGLKYQQDDVQIFEKTSAMAREPMLKAWVDRTLPTLRYHLTLAERIAPPRTISPVAARPIESNIR